MIILLFFTEDSCFLNFTGETRKFKFIPIFFSFLRNITINLLEIAFLNTALNFFLQGFPDDFTFGHSLKFIWDIFVSVALRCYHRKKKTVLQNSISRILNCHWKLQYFILYCYIFCNNLSLQIHIIVHFELYIKNSKVFSFFI